MKVTGAEWKEFEEHGWPDGYIWSDDPAMDHGAQLFAPDGSLSVADSDTFTIDPDWGMYWEGAIGQSRPPNDPDDGYSVLSVFRKWRKTKTHATVVVTVPIADVDRAVEYCKSQKWHVAR